MIDNMDDEDFEGQTLFSYTFAFKNIFLLCIKNPNLTIRTVRITILFPLKYFILISKT